MTNGWTGGQYSLYRALFGLYLFVHFATLLPSGTALFSNSGVLPSASPLLKLFPNVLSLSDAPTIVSILISIGAIAAVGFSLGLYDRAAAALIWYVLMCLYSRNPLIADPSLTFVAWLLLLHTVLPPSPYGSWSARGRIDPRGGWRMPPELFAAAWVVLSLAYAFSAYTKIVSRDLLLAAPIGPLRLMAWGALALELVYAPLALFRRARPWIWSAMFVMQIGFILIGLPEFSVGMAMVHLFTLDPGWIPARRSERREYIFYDGHCGLCHRGIRFVLAEDLGGKAFTFAPLQGDTCATAIAPEERRDLPDSVVVRTETRQVLTRSDALIYILERLGGLWRVLAAGLSLVPRFLRNAVYDVIARNRHHLFAREAATCPILPADLRSRFQE